MRSLQVPKNWDEITPDWMSTALSERHPGATVKDVTLELRDDGTNRRARLGLTFSAGSGPATVFVKAADPAHKELIRMTSGMFHEPRLFTSGVKLPLEHPLVYAALIDEDAYDFFMVMEDLNARKADPRDSTRPLTVEQAVSGVRGLGRMHGQFWGERVLNHPALGWLEPFVPWDGMQYAPLPSALERLGDDAPDEVMALSIEQLIESIWKPYITTLSASPQTLLHGDPHIGNTYVLPLGYFLQGALTIEDRREHERDLLGEYRDALALPDDEMPTTDDIWLRYRASVAHGLTLWLCTASSDGGLWQRIEVAVTLAQRYAAAYADLDTPSALSDITP